ncbi:MAG: Gldg family protein [Planctomycetota bacterium]|nr:Gldg family protein [Planctomycetota bacterium]
MSESNSKSSVAANLPPETQKERWVKYGANVALTCVVVIVLAVLITFLAQAHAKRIDTTLGGSQSLRPQTVDFVKGLKDKISILALYPRLKPDSREQDYYQPVADLLADYASKGQHITVELINPDTDKDRLTRLIGEVTNKYGGEAKGYKALLTDLPPRNETLQKYAVDEDAKLAALPEAKDQNLQQKVLVARLTLRGMVSQLATLKEAIDTDLAQQIPSYKDAVDQVRTVYSQASQNMGLLTEVLESFKSDPTVPAAFKDYAPDAETRQAAITKVTAAVLDRITHLGELKELDEFRRQLTTNSILVMTDTGYKILQFGDLWKVPEQSRILGGSDAKPHMAFAGEQQITAAIASLTGGKRPMVVFVRPGGAPLATSMNPEQEAPLGAVAQRLREYNFDVQEKDASGQSAGQEQAAPEPTDEQMKSAIWVVIRLPGDNQGAMGMPGSSPVNAMVDKHLKEGGSAMILLMPTDDAMNDVLAPWGIQAKTDYAIAHDVATGQARRSTDPLDSILQSNQVVFLLNEYGNHPIAAPLQGLGFLTYGTAPIAITPNSPAFIKAAGLLPVPLNPHAWASSDTQALMRGRGDKVQFTPKADSEAHPIPDLDNTADNRLYCAAASEKTGGGRVVVVGSANFATGDLVNLREADRPDISRLPGNAEFFTDSIFWLAHLDQMLEIGPHALETARIRDMSPAALAFWRVGVLTVGLPFAVIVAGLLVYVRRRD